MIRIFIILLSIFSFHSLIKADDIRDFQIEGMSIGDSLLDNYKKSEIKKNTLKDEYPKSNAMRRVSFILTNIATISS